MHYLTPLVWSLHGPLQAHAGYDVKCQSQGSGSISHPWTLFWKNRQTNRTGLCHILIAIFNNCCSCHIMPYKIQNICIWVCCLNHDTVVISVICIAHDRIQCLQALKSHKFNLSVRQFNLFFGPVIRLKEITFQFVHKSLRNNKLKT